VAEGVFLSFFAKNVEMVMIDIVPSGLFLCQRGRSCTIGSSAESEIPRRCFDTAVL